VSESSYEDGDLTAGATVDGDGEAVDSATADQEAAFDDPVRSAEGTVRVEDALVAKPVQDPADVTTGDAAPDTSHDADVAAGYDGNS
jgi:hypothetical protein